MSSVEPGPELPAEDLAELEERLQTAFVDGDERGLDVLGYGEISTVVGWTVGETRFAAKRLPDFDTEARFERYHTLFERYLGALAAGGVTPVPSRLQVLSRGGTHSAWCVQPRLPSGGLLPNVMRESSRDEAVALFETITDRVANLVGPTVGLDGQLSNWVLVEGELRYLDVTTPLLRDERGESQLDADLFLASLPWVLRGPVKALLLRKILDRYHEPRGVLLDVIGNLYKEKLEGLVDPLLEVANARIDGPPITGREARRYYDDDARTWAVLQQLRRVDRAWQRAVRRRPYPFLLPGEIER